VWVCAMSKQSLTPCLFIQSACGDCFPLEASAQWIRAGRPPRPARRSGTLALVHGKSGEGLCQENRVHLFSARVADTIAIERRTVLADWRFPTRIDGAVVVLDRNDADDGAHRLFRAFRPEVNRTLLWMKAQDMPFVVAAVGYEGGGFLGMHFTSNSTWPLKYDRLWTFSYAGSSVRTRSAGLER